MRSLRWILLVVVAWMSTHSVAAAFADVERRLNLCRLGAYQEPGFATSAAAGGGTSTDYGHAPPRQSPVVCGRPKLFFRVVHTLVLSIGNHALLECPAIPDKHLPRFECSFSGPGAVGHCVFLCRFLL
jgi:hypothetical protein